MGAVRAFDTDRPQAAVAQAADVMSSDGNRAALTLVGLLPLMANGVGRPETMIALIDGPVALAHPDLAAENIREIAPGLCAQATSVACRHGTFVAGVLSGRRRSVAPAICPGCTLLLRPIFPEHAAADTRVPSATPEALAEAIVDSVDAGAQVINLSAAIGQPSTRCERHLHQALDHAAQRGTIVVAAAGNWPVLGSSAITRHPWVVPVTACDLRGRPVGNSTLGASIARRGLRAPGLGISSLGSDGQPPSFGGTSIATPFVSGAVALLWSVFPGASAAELRLAIGGAGTTGRTSVVPPLLDAMAAYATLAHRSARRGAP